jgi:hypothetical protein
MLRTKEFEAAGREYTISELTMGDLAALQNYLHSKRGKWPTDAELGNALKEMDSMIFLLHRSLKKAQPDITEAMAGELFPMSRAAEFAALITWMMETPKNPTKPVEPADK